MNHIRVRLTESGSLEVAWKPQVHDDAAKYSIVPRFRKLGVVIDEPRTFRDAGIHGRADLKKMKDLHQIYHDRIDRSRWPDYILELSSLGFDEFRRKRGLTTSASVEESLIMPAAPVDEATAIDTAFQTLTSFQHPLIIEVLAAVMESSDDHAARTQLVRAHLFVRKSPRTDVRQVIAAMRNPSIGKRGMPRRAAGPREKGKQASRRSAARTSEGNGAAAGIAGGIEGQASVGAQDGGHWERGGTLLPSGSH